MISCVSAYNFLCIIIIYTYHNNKNLQQYIPIPYLYPYNIGKLVQFNQYFYSFIYYYQIKLHTKTLSFVRFQSKFLINILYLLIFKWDGPGDWFLNLIKKVICKLFMGCKIMPTINVSFQVEEIS